jgi:hypothetical protein
MQFFNILFCLLIMISVGNSACTALLAQFSSLSAVQSIRVDTHSPGSTCFGCSVSLRLTPPERPCFLSSTVIASNITSNLTAITAQSYVDVMLRFSTAVQISSTSSSLPVTFGNTTFNATYAEGNGTFAIKYRATFATKVEGKYAFVVQPGNLYQTLQTIRSLGPGKLSAVPETPLTPLVICSTCAFDCSGKLLRFVCC